MTTGERIVKLRKENNYTQEKLAELMDVSRQSVSKWESDIAYPDIDKLIKLSDLFDCSIDYLLKNEKENAETGDKPEVGTGTETKVETEVEPGDEREAETGIEPELDGVGTGTEPSVEKDIEKKSILNDETSKHLLKIVVPVVSIIVVCVIAAVAIQQIHHKNGSDEAMTEVAVEGTNTDANSETNSETNSESVIVENKITDDTLQNDAAFIQAYTSSKELSAAVNVYFQNSTGSDVYYRINDLKFTKPYTFSRYESTDNGKARIVYLDEEKRHVVEYYKYLGTDKMTGDNYDSKYGTESDMNISDINVTLRERYDGYTWANWIYNGYENVLIFQEGVTYSDITSIVSQVKSLDDKDKKSKTGQNADQVSQVIGFDIDDIAEFKENSVEVKYNVYQDKLAAVRYQFYQGKDSFCLYKSKTSDDMFTDYLIKYERTMFPEDRMTGFSYKDINEITLYYDQILNDIFNYKSARWTKGAYSYALTVDKQMTKEQIIEIIQQIIDHG